MTTTALSTPQRIGRDLTAGLVVFLVALPLCLGIALASGAPLFSGLLAGIVGGLVVAAISGSHTSVSGPAAGLTAVVAAQLAALGSFEAFLVAVMIGGVIQVGLGIARMGFIASFVPSSVIKGLLAAIGVILILKQIPHVVGHDPDPMGEMAFSQPDNQNTFSELIATFGDVQPGAALIGFLSLALLIAWARIDFLKNSPIPAPLVVVVGAALLSEFVLQGTWKIDTSHLVQVPVATSLTEARGLLTHPDFSILRNPAVYTGGLTIAIVASLETLLNLEAVDRIDPQQRVSPPNRELVAQGVGNIVGGFIGALPVTSVIVRSSVNIQNKNETKLSAIWHALLLVGSVLLIPKLINSIPLACLAAILLMTGFKLASPKLMKQMWAGGYQTFAPFAITVAAIVLIDLLWGIVIGLGVALLFILRSNFKAPLKKIMERHASGDLLRIELATQVSFFSRAALERALDTVQPGEHVLIDARQSVHIDPDVLDFIQDYQTKTAPARGVELSLMGLKGHYDQLSDTIQYVDYATRELQRDMQPQDALRLLTQGNERFRSGTQISRDLMRQVQATADEQTPFAVILTCIDTRAPAEHIFDLGIGDIFVVRIAGNIAKEKVLGSIEYACAVAGAKLVVVLGHTSCGAVTAAIDFAKSGKSAGEALGCQHIDALLGEVQSVMKPEDVGNVPADSTSRKAFIDRIARDNVIHTMSKITDRSSAIADLVETGAAMVVGAMYDVSTGMVEFFDESGDLPALSDGDREKIKPKAASKPKKKTRKKEQSEADDEGRDEPATH